MPRGNNVWNHTEISVVWMHGNQVNHFCRKNDLTFIKDWALTVQLLPAPSSSRISTVHYRRGKGNVQWGSIIKTEFICSALKTEGMRMGRARERERARVVCCQVTNRLCAVLKTIPFCMQNETVYQQLFWPVVLKKCSQPEKNTFISTEFSIVTQDQSK